MTLRILVVILALGAAAASCGSSRDGNATVASIADLGHVHDIVVENDDVYLAAHSGLFRVESQSRAVLVGEFRHDFMSMASSANGLVASGHPDLRFDEWRIEGQPAHLGFLSSTDFGGSWEKVSLLGEVDFHSLASSADRGFYGADSSGGILASADGVTWGPRSPIGATDLSASPHDADSIVAIDGQCAANGTYSSHNVVVETKGNKVYAYVAWYWDGMLVLDVTDPYDPVEIARYLDTSGPNDGAANDFWGIYKEDNSPHFYGSDRNGGLYIFKLKGSGSGK